MKNNKMPHFEYHITNPYHMNFGCIEADGQVIHRICNTDEFYEEFGYTAGMRKAGVVPEEFIWDEYIQNIAIQSADCIKIHIVKYLIKHSETFRGKYGDQCEGWLVAHAKETVASGIACVACKSQLCGAEKIW
jgi:hypothetical protein